MRVQRASHLGTSWFTDWHSACSPTSCPTSPLIAFDQARICKALCTRNARSGNSSGMGPSPEQRCLEFWSREHIRRTLYRPASISRCKPEQASLGLTTTPTSRSSPDKWHQGLPHCRRGSARYVCPQCILTSINAVLISRFRFPGTGWRERKNPAPPPAAQAIQPTAQQLHNATQRQQIAETVAAFRGTHRDPNAHHWDEVSHSTYNFART